MNEYIFVLIGYYDMFFKKKKISFVMFCWVFLFYFMYDCNMVIR